MGLDTTHNCWHGSCTAFGKWREEICRLSGHGEIYDHIGFGGTIPWPKGGDALVELLDHSDCEGLIEARYCGAIALRLEELLPRLKELVASDDRRWMIEATERWIEGLRDAADHQEDVFFQ